MQDVRACLDHSTPAHPFRLAVVIELERAFTNEGQFRVFVLVRGMRHLPGQERRLMHFDELARRQNAVQYLPGHGPTRRMGYWQLLERKRLGSRQNFLPGSLPFRCTATDGSECG